MLQHILQKYNATTHNTPNAYILSFYHFHTNLSFSVFEALHMRHGFSPTNVFFFFSVHIDVTKTRVGTDIAQVATLLKNRWKS